LSWAGVCDDPATGGLALGLVERDDAKRVFAPWQEIRIPLPLPQAA
jgi:hypothetical protein